jgi:hypothetical protein
LLPYCPYLLSLRYLTYLLKQVCERASKSETRLRPRNSRSFLPHGSLSGHPCVFLFQKLVLGLPGSFIIPFRTSQSRFFFVLPSDSPQKSHISFLIGLSFATRILRSSHYCRGPTLSLLFRDWILTNWIYKLPGAFNFEYKT